MSRGSKIVPYVIVLAIVSYLYFLATKIDFVAPGGRIGPDVWPKAILLLAMVACGYESVKNLLFGRADRDLDPDLGHLRVARHDQHALGTQGHHSSGTDDQAAIFVPDGDQWSVEDLGRCRARGTDAAIEGRRDRLREPG